MKFAPFLWAVAATTTAQPTSAPSSSAIPSDLPSDIISSALPSAIPTASPSTRPERASLDEALAKWTALNTTDYHFSFQLRDPFQQYSWAPIHFVSVKRDGNETGQEYVDKVESRFNTPVSDIAGFPTMNEIFEGIQAALDLGAEHIDVRYDLTHGFPAFLNISSDGFQGQDRRRMKEEDHVPVLTWYMRPKSTIAQGAASETMESHRGAKQRIQLKPKRVGLNPRRDGDHRLRVQKPHQGRRRIIKGHTVTILRQKLGTPIEERTVTPQQLADLGAKRGRPDLYILENGVITKYVAKETLSGRVDEEPAKDELAQAARDPVVFGGRNDKRPQPKGINDRALAAGTPRYASKVGLAGRNGQFHLSTNRRSKLSSPLVRVVKEATAKRLVAERGIPLETARVSMEELISLGAKRGRTDLLVFDGDVLVRYVLDDGDERRRMKYTGNKLIRNLGRKLAKKVRGSSSETHRRYLVFDPPSSEGLNPKFGKASSGTDDNRDIQVESEMEANNPQMENAPVLDRVDSHFSQSEAKGFLLVNKPDIPKEKRVNRSGEGRVANRISSSGRRMPDKIRGADFSRRRLDVGHGKNKNITRGKEGKKKVSISSGNLAIKNGPKNNVRPVHDDSVVQSTRGEDDARPRNKPVVTKDKQLVRSGRGSHQTVFDARGAIGRGQKQLGGRRLVEMENANWSKNEDYIQTYRELDEPGTADIPSYAPSYGPSATPSGVPSTPPSSAPSSSVLAQQSEKTNLPPFIVISIRYFTPFDVLQHQLDAAKARWATVSSTGDYTMRYRRICFCAPPYTEPRFVEVRNGEVVSVAIDSPMMDAELSAQFQKHQETVAGVFDSIQEAIWQRAASIEVGYDPATGFPMYASIDYSAALADEEYYVTIQDVVIGTGGA